jgi:hypothetical protein
MKKITPILIAVFLGLMIASLARLQNFTFEKYIGVSDVYVLAGLVLATIIIVIISRTIRMK